MATRTITGPLDGRADAILPRGQRGGGRGRARCRTASSRRPRSSSSTTRTTWRPSPARSRRTTTSSRARTDDPHHRPCRGPGRPGAERRTARGLRARRAGRRRAPGAERAARRHRLLRRGRHRLRGHGDLSLLAHDFSVLYVAENNATTTPPFISAISLWAALEGSILFWTLLATGWASLVMWRHRDRHRVADAVGRRDAGDRSTLFFFAVMIWPGNPFARTSAGGGRGASARTRCSRTTRSWRSIRRCCTWATPGWRCRSRSAWRRSSRRGSTRSGCASCGAGRWCRGPS